MKKLLLSFVISSAVIVMSSCGSDSGTNDSSVGVDTTAAQEKDTSSNIRVRPIGPVAYWEGKIRAEKTYQGLQGRYKWVGEYRVLLGEDRPHYVSRLFPLELDYTIDADEALDKECYGVYHGRSHARRVLGYASGRLRGESLDPDPTSESPMFKKLSGKVNHGEADDQVLPPFDPNEERYWDVCYVNISRKAYDVRINFFAGRSRSDARLLPLFQGIQASGDGLLRDLQENPLAFLVTGEEAVNPHICGLIDRPDQEVFRGSHSFSSRSKRSSCEGGHSENAGANITINWELRRTKRRPTEETPSAGPTGGTRRTPGGGVPGADLALTVRGAPSVPVGAELVYKLAVTNKGPGTALGTVLTDNLPAGVRFISAQTSRGSCSGTSTVVCNLANLENRGSATVAIVIAPTAPSSLIHSAKVISSVPDINPTNNSATSTTRAY